MKEETCMTRNFTRYCIVIPLVLTIILFGGLFCQVCGVSAAEAIDEKIITVYGEGAVFGKPTVAYIHLGVETEEPDAVTAQQENARRMSGVIQVLTEMGFEEDDIKTANFSIYPVRGDFTSAGQYKIVGYRVSNTLIVTVRDLDKIGEVLDATTKAGVNAINNIIFDIEGSTAMYHEALRLAVSDALAKARIITEALGMKLCGPVRVYESSSSKPVAVDVYDMRVMMASSEYSTPIIPGDVSVRASVSIEFAME
jgi:uncharacterized protein YggE